MSFQAVQCANAIKFVTAGMTPMFGIHTKPRLNKQNCISLDDIPVVTCKEVAKRRPLPLHIAAFFAQDCENKEGQFALLTFRKWKTLLLFNKLRQPNKKSGAHCSLSCYELTVVTTMRHKTFKVGVDS